MRIERIFRMLCSFCGTFLLFTYGFPNSVAGPAISPPKAQTYGKSSAGWLRAYYNANLGSEKPETIGKVLLLPSLIPGTPSGSGTLDDPLTLRAEGAITIKPGTSIYGVLIGFYGERFEDGSEDPVLPDDWWKTYVSGEIWLDGKQVPYNFADRYVAPQFFDPPIVYPEPTDIGSVATLFAQGNGFLLQPLSVGTHILVMNAAVLAPEDNGVIPETAIIFQYTYKICVKP